MMLSEMNPGQQVYIPMRTGTDEEGNAIWTDTAFMVMQQGKPNGSYDDSFLGGTVLMQSGKAAYYQKQLVGNYNQNGKKCDYASTCAHRQYLASGGAFEQILDPEIALQVLTVRIPYRVGTDGSTVKYDLEAKYWLPSAAEVALSGGDDADEQEESPFYVQEGASFDYFADKNPMDYADWLATDSGGRQGFWFTRTPAESIGSIGFYAVDELGRAYPYDSGEYAGRVCMVLPGKARVGESGHLHFGGNLPMKQDGVWKDTSAFCKVDGVWREVSCVGMKVGGVWKT